MIFHDVEQNTDEWLELRVGKLTGSGYSKIMANYGKAFGDPAKKLAIDIAVEQVTGKMSVNESFSNHHTERGHEQEPFARALYEDMYFVDVDNGGFFDCGKTGCSPDGLVGDDGLIEIKSVVRSTHYANMKRGSVDPSYKWQVLSNLMKTEREWIDFVSYCADFPERTRLFVHRVYAADCDGDFEMMQKRESQFFQLVGEMKQMIQG